MRAKTVLYLLPRLPEVIAALRGMRSQEILSTRDHMRLCADWLLMAQKEAGGGGYMASYSLVTGKRQAYIETTGYIIPTMLELAEVLADPRCRDSAYRAAEWLLTVQLSNGAFPDIDQHKPQVFDTGQVMVGLHRMYRETNDSRFLESTRRAADWLASIQDVDGSWTSAGYHPGQPATYHTRVAAVMLEAAQWTGSPAHRDGGLKCLRWAASRQQENGYFLDSELHLGADPVLHTIVYVLEGYLAAYQITDEKEWLDILLKAARPMVEAQLNRDLVLRSQYASDWKVTNSEKCVPGLAQWAAICGALHDITREPEWIEASQLTIYYIKSKQLREAGILNGALPASVPLWGYYHPMMFPNWAIKYFADALLLYDKHCFAVWQEQETWVGKCFALGLDGGSWRAHSDKLEALDMIVLSAVESTFAERNKEEIRILDLGCGAGRYVRELARRHPEWQVFGVDPCAADNGGAIRKGSAYSIPFGGNDLDGAFSVIALQHISGISRVLAEVRRVLKPGATFIICDRHPFSARGLLKPLHEIRGRWMYPWDSPFRERWHTAARWKDLLRKAGFAVSSIRTFGDPSARGIRRHIPTNRFLLITTTLMPQSEHSEKSYIEKPFTGRWLIGQTNRVLSPLKVRVESLTAERSELNRLNAAHKRGWYSRPVFPLPLSFEQCKASAVLDLIPRYHDRLKRFAHAEDNDVGYAFDNHYFRPPDAEVLYALLREKKPKRVIETGCGNSTRVMRQAIIDGTLNTTLTCIDPWPREEVSSLADEFICARIESQDAAELADTLYAGDFLFIDTSHEVRVANDIAFIFGCLIPKLRPGVIVHVHDIFLPFEYPWEWAYDLRLHTWGEQYVVQAMLEESRCWKCIWPGYYFQRTLPDFARKFPDCGDNYAQSLWLEKVSYV